MNLTIYYNTYRKLLIHIKFGKAIIHIYILRRSKQHLLIFSLTGKHKFSFLNHKTGIGDQDIKFTRAAAIA